MISSSVGLGFLSIRALPDITIPGIQNPHCTAPFDPNAYTNASFSKSLNPSTETMFIPCALFVVITQALVAFPSIIIVQVPQAP